MKLQRLIGALLAVMLSAAPARAAEQGSYVIPDTGPKSMATLVDVYFNPAFRALASCHWGTSAPTNGPSSAPIVYQCWADTTSNPVLFKVYDGASWITYGALNTSTHVWTPYRNGAAIVAVATSGSAADLTTGTLPAARIPNPSASTLGGVQSKTCSASQWLNDVSTGGVLSCSQPNFTDLAGSASLAQLPAFSGMSAAAAAADADTFPTNQGAGNLKQTLAAIKTWIKAWIAKADVGLGNVDNTSDATKWAATATITNKTFVCANQASCVVRLGSDVTGQLPLTNIATGTQDTILGYFGATSVSAATIGNCSNSLTYSTTTHLFGCNTSAGTGTLTQLNQGGGIALSPSPITSTGTVSLRQTTVQVLNSGTAATYTSPAGSKYIIAQFCGGGGGGSGSGTGATMGSGGNGGGTIFDTVTAGGGSAGTNSGGGTAGAGGTITGSPDISWLGANGAGVVTVSTSGLSSGVPGGASPLWGGANINAAPTANSGAGGASGLFNGAGNTGAGGGSGACAEVYRAGGGATYTYTIGAGGTSGTAGTSGGVGLAGAAGRLIVREH